jgi:cytochrome o ubiquinol oxidase operon protein cyoD
MSKTAIEFEEHPLSYGKYVLGFVLSVILTLTAYLLVTHMTDNKNVTVAVISCLALVQFIVQMVFFLHIGEEKKPRWKRLVMWFMLGIVFLIVAGSIWIMNNLNYRMSPQQMEQYMKSQDAL